MTAGDDLIRLDDAFFAGIGAVGVLNADAFHIGTAAPMPRTASSTTARRVNCSTTSNGNAAGGSTLFANLATGLALNNMDFNVV